MMSKSLFAKYSHRKSETIYYGYWMGPRNAQQRVVTIKLRYMFYLYIHASVLDRPIFYNTRTKYVVIAFNVSYFRSAFSSVSAT